MNRRRAAAYVLCMAAAVLVAAGMAAKAFWPDAPDRYASLHPAEAPAPLMGFAPDSVFNAGSAEELDAFPGVGEVISRRIIEGRDILGDYRLPTDLLLVKGVGPKTLEGIMDALDEEMVALDTWPE